MKFITICLFSINLIFSSLSYGQACLVAYIPRGNLFAPERTTLCQNDTLYLESVPGSEEYQRVWFRNGVALTGLHDRILSISQAGIYACKLFNGTCYSKAYDSVIVTSNGIKRPARPILSINQQPIEAGDPFSLSIPPINNVAYKWYKDNILLSDITNSISTNNPGNYRVELDSLGCLIASNTIEVDPNDASKVSLCAVDYSNGLRLSWKSTGSGIQFHKVYRRLAGEVEFTEFGIDIMDLDGAIDTNISNYNDFREYKVTALTTNPSNGQTYESKAGSSHRTIYLKVTAPPTIFEHNILSWNEYKGFLPARYVIFRNDTPIDTVSGNTTVYEDVNFSGFASYQVQALTTVGCQVALRSSQPNLIQGYVRTSKSNKGNAIQRFIPPDESTPYDFGPTNDACANAIQLESGLRQAGSFLRATKSLTNNFCSGILDPNAPDLWYSFTKEVGVDTLVVFNSSNLLIANIRPLSCSIGQSLLCGTINNYDQGFVKIVLSSLTNGQVYKILVRRTVNSGVNEFALELPKSGTFRVLGTSANPYTILYPGPYLNADPSLNAVFLSRRGGTGFGNNLYYDISTNGGQDFTLNRGPIYTPAPPSGNINSYGIRYPKSILFNPVGNTNLSKAFNFYQGPLIAGTNDIWGGYAFGMHRLNNSSQPFGKVLTDNSAFQINGALAGIAQAGNAVFSVLLERNNFDLIDLPRLMVWRNLINEATNTFTKDSTLITLPVSTTGKLYKFINPKIAFGPGGQYGCIAMSAYVPRAEYMDPADESYHPFFYLTKNGGLTWDGPYLLNLTDDPGMKGLRNEIFGDSVLEGSVKRKAFYGTAFEFDVSVDNQNSIHFLSRVCWMGMKNPTDASYLPNYTVWSAYSRIVDLFTVNGNIQSWNYDLLGEPQAFRGTFYSPSVDAFSIDNRPQITRTKDGSALWFSWFDTDIDKYDAQVSGLSNQNIKPDLFLRGKQIIAGGPNKLTRLKNFTNGSTYQGSILAGSLSPIALGIDHTAKIPLSFAIFGSTAQSPITHMYMDGLKFESSDYVNNPVTKDDIPIQPKPWTNLPIPTLSSTATNGTACDSVVLSATGATIGQSYLWTNGATSQSIVVKSSGTYRAYIVSSCCTSQISAPFQATVVKKPNPPKILSSNFQNTNFTFCSQGKIYTKSDDTTHLWYRNGSLLPGASDSLAIALAGNYTVRLNFNGCSSAVSASVAITINTPPSKPAISGTSSRSICQGSSTNLSVSNPQTGTTYLWSNAQTGNSIGVSQSGNYTVQAIAQSCTSLVSPAVVLSVQPIPSTPGISGTANQSICQGSSVNLSVSNPQTGTTYLWSNAQTGNSISVSQAGNYTVQAIAQSCTSLVSPAVVLSIQPIPSTPGISGTANQSICQGSSANLSVSNPQTGTTYLWSNAQTGNSISVSQAGNYSVQAIAQSCTSLVSPAVVLSIQPIPSTPGISGTANQSICQGSSVNLSVSNPQTGTAYLWSNAQSGNSIGVSQSGNYTVQAIAQSCTSLVSPAVVLSVQPIPSTPGISGTANQSICQGSSVNLSVSNPQTGTTYLWSNAQTGNSISVSQAGNYTVQAIAQSCTSLVSPAVVLSIQPIPSTPGISGTANQSICQGSSANLSVSNPQTGTTYLWSNAQTGNSISVSQAGNYSVQAIAQSCTSLVSPAVVLSIQPIPSTPGISGTANQSICQGSSVNLSVSNPQTGTAYLWSNAQSGNSIGVSQSGNYTVQAIAQSCTSLVSPAVVLSVQPIPSTPGISGTANQSICQGSSVNLSVSNPQTGTTYLWSNAQTGNSISVSQAGNYTVQAIAQSCTSLVSPAVVLSIQPIPSTPGISGTANQSICQGSSANLSVSNPQTGTTYLWSNAQTGNSISVSQAGNYSVQAIAQSCTSLVSPAVVLSIQPIPSTPGISGTANQSICQGSSVNLSVSNPQTGTTYLWSNAQSGNSISVSQAGNYSVQAIAQSCTSLVSPAVVLSIQPIPSTPGISGTANQSICQGSSVNLSVSNPQTGTTYLWSNAQTGNSISVSQAGNYSVQAIAQSCTSFVSVPKNLTIVPIPLSPTISIISDTLVSSAINGNQWYSLEFGLLPGAVNYYYKPQNSGGYFVVVSQDGCQSPSSDTIQFVPNLLEIKTTTSFIRVFPNPANNSFNIESNFHNLEIQCFDSFGKSLKLEEIEELKYSIENLPVGIYFLRIVAEKSNIKFIVLEKK